MPQPWEQQPGEADAAYAAFLLFRDLGRGRSARAAYAKHGGHDPAAKQVPGRWKDWSTRHEWIARAAAWDNRVQQVADQASEKVVAADAAAKTRRQILAERRLLHEDNETAIARMLLSRGVEHLRGTSGAAMATRDALTAIRLFHQIGRAANRMPLTVEQDETDDFGDGLYATKGQLAAELPEGVVPDMPDDTFGKPDLAAAAGPEAAVKRPDKRNRERPLG